MATMPSVFNSLPLLRQAAPRLSRQFFTCHAARSPSKKLGARSAFQPSTASSKRPLQSRWATIAPAIAPESSSPLASLGRTINGRSKSSAKTSFFPETSDKIVAYWLLGSAASVLGIVIFGGLTRLTESGLVLRVGESSVTNTKKA